MLEPFLIVKREVSMFQSISGQCVGNAGMLSRNLLSFAGLFRRLRVHTKSVQHNTAVEFALYNYLGGMVWL